MRRCIEIFVALLGLVFAGNVCADPQSVVTPIAQVPAAVQKTIQTEVDKAKGVLGNVEKTTEDDETWYDVELTTGQRTRSMSIAPDGRLLTWQVFMNEIPVPARKAIREHVQTANGRLGDIDRVVEEGIVTFDVTMTKGGKETTFTVNREGKLVSQQMEFSETPDAVQKAIRAQTAGATVKKIEKNIDDEDGEITYDIETVKGGKKVSITLDADGKLQE